MTTQKQITERENKNSIKELSKKFNIGQDFILNGKWGEIVEILSNGLLIEFSNRTRKVITKSQLKEGDLI